jgi:hypothetical protein
LRGAAAADADDAGGASYHSAAPGRLDGQAFA